MSGDPIDQSIIFLARAYLACLTSAKSKDNDPMTAGTQAQKKWIADIASRGGIRIRAEPRTGVDSAGGGQSRFDVLFTIARTDVYVEVQATDYSTGHKPIQAQGQLLGFAHVSGADVPARYYKIIGQPRRIYCWIRGPAQAALVRGEYSPQRILYY